MFNEFKGIRPLVDGIVDSVYDNVVPTGSTVVDRTCYYLPTDLAPLPSVSTTDGEPNIFGRPQPLSSTVYSEDDFDWTKLNWDVDYVSLFTAEHVVPVKCFVLDDKTVVRFYVTNDSTILSGGNDSGDGYYTQHLFVHLRSYDSNENISKDAEIKQNYVFATPVPVRLERVGNSFAGEPDYSHISCCVSNVRPRQLYFTFDYRCIYVIDIDKMSTNNDIRCMCCDVDLMQNLIDSEPDSYILRDFDMNNEEGCENTREIYNDLVWYDNKLCVLDRNSGVFRLSCTDPAQFYRNEITTSTNKWSEYGINNLWTNWYSSTLSTDTLVKVVPAYGNLFFINTNSIEVWTRTGTETAPLTNVSNFSIKVRVTVAELVGNTLYAIGTDGGRLGAFIITPSSINRISNSAVEEYFSNTNYTSRFFNHIGYVMQNREQHIGFFNNLSGVTMCYDQNKQIWYRLTDTAKNQAYYFVDFNKWLNSAGRDVYAAPINADFSIVGSTKLLERKVIDCSNSFSRRCSFNMLEVYGSLASTYRPIITKDRLNTAIEGDFIFLNNLDEVTNGNVVIRDNVSMRLSTDNGKTWNRERYVKTPPLGKYDAKLQWFGLGSGENALLELRWYSTHYFVLTGINLSAR